MTEERLTQMKETRGRTEKKKKIEKEKQKEIKKIFPLLYIENSVSNYYIVLEIKLYCY